MRNGTYKGTTLLKIAILIASALAVHQGLQRK